MRELLLAIILLPENNRSYVHYIVHGGELMGWFIYFIVPSACLFIAAGLLSCLYIGKRSDEQGQRLHSLLRGNSLDSMQLSRQDLERFFTAYEKIA
jgi:hypothetical protein